MRRTATPRKFCMTAAMAIAFALSLATVLPAADQAAEPQFRDDQLEFFESKVRPLLVEHCYKCHGPENSAKGGLRLISRDHLLRGGDSGPAISSSEPGESLLLEAINYATYEMPPSGKLPSAAIDTITRWVEMGAPWPARLAATAETSHAEQGPPAVDEQAKQFWSFRPPAIVPVPPVASTGAHPIDAFILARLEQHSLSPTPPAARTELLRRAYYDLIGLPPNPAEVADFLADDRTDAFERVVDRLLESPHYGEKWARHWLDLVRYAESNSYERDDPKPFVWRYRDYVIRAFNSDKPYTQFILEQLAGDELAESTPQSIVATGYYRLGPWQDEPVDAEQELFEDLDDLVRTTGEAFLGLTIGCARCHDHKLDPIPQKDYYRFLAFFRNVKRFGIRSHESVREASLRTIAPLEQRRRHAEAVERHRTATRRNRRELARLEKRLVADLVGVEQDDWKTEAARIEIAEKRIGSLLSAEEFARFKELSRERDQLRKFRPPGLDQALSVKEHGRQAPETFVLVRGNAHVPGEKVNPGFLEVLSPPPPEIEPPAADVESTGRRLALAKWIASPDNPLTARVIVNRIWQHHFGRGLVRTPSDFGYQGAAPTHPDLLDWLARDFIEGGWRFKRMHKQIMLTDAYQRSSRATAEGLRKDPTNDLFWRFDMRRLSAEEIRDSILAVNGELNREAMFGPSIYPKIPEEVLSGQSRPGHGWGKSSDSERSRRSIYIHIKRSLVVPLLASFDVPESDASCPVRFSTTQPTQSLSMLNSEFIDEQARSFASYLRDEAGDNPRAQVELALWRTLQREPSEQELQRGVKLLGGLRGLDLSPEKALLQFCVTMFNLNEFIYLD